MTPIRKKKIIISNSNAQYVKSDLMKQIYIVKNKDADLINDDKLKMNDETRILYS